MQDPHHIPRYANGILFCIRWVYADGIVELLKAFDSYDGFAARIDGYPKPRINRSTGIRLKLSYINICIYSETRRFVLLEPSEHRRRLDEVDMIMKMARKMIACSPDQVITALRMLPDMIGLQK